MKQKAISKECAEWIKQKVTFKSNDGKGNMPAGFINVDNRSLDNELLAYMPVQEFTTAGIGAERGNNTYNMVNKFEETAMSQEYLNIFNSIWNNPDMVNDVTDIVLDSISNAYRENSPRYMYFVILYNIFHEFLENISEDDLPQEVSGYKESKIWNLLYSFQKDAALGVISKLEKYNGCILADSVGLGKTFTALAVIKYYENKNRNVLVLCPKKLSENWNTYKGNYRSP